MQHGAELSARSEKILVELRKSHIDLKKQLASEKAKMARLTSQDPMNVHRWRVLGGKDPTAIELIDKVNQLQKTLISKTNVSNLKGVTHVMYFMSCSFSGIDQKGFEGRGPRT